MCFLAVRGEVDLMTRSLEDVCQDDPVGGFVLDDEYACHDTVPPLGRWGGSGLMSVC